MPFLPHAFTLDHDGELSSRQGIDRETIQPTVVAFLLIPLLSFPLLRGVSKSGGDSLNGFYSPLQPLLSSFVLCAEQHSQ